MPAGKHFSCRSIIGSALVECRALRIEELNLMPRTKSIRPRRRTRGEGSVYSKVRTWTSGGKSRRKTIWVAASRVGERGKRRRLYFYGNTANEARAKRDRFLVDNGSRVPEPKLDECQTVAEYAATFLEHALHKSKATTHRSYSQTLKRHILPRLGAMRLSSLSTSDVRGFYNALRVSASMKHRIHGVLRAMLNLAKEEELIDSSPLDRIRKTAPRYKAARVKPPTRQQIGTLLKIARAHRLEALFVLAALHGLRQGELFALRWSDVDEADRSLSIS